VPLPRSLPPSPVASKPPPARPPALPKAPGLPGERVAPALAAARDGPVGPRRTVEDVRADLAKLRAASRVRQVQQEVERHTDFAPTDLMEPATGLPPPPAPTFDDFAPTQFRPFLGSLPAHGR